MLDGSQNIIYTLQSPDVSKKLEHDTPLPSVLVCEKKLLPRNWKNFAI